MHTEEKEQIHIVSIEIALQNDIEFYIRTYVLEIRVYPSAHVKATQRWLPYVLKQVSSAGQGETLCAHSSMSKRKIFN